MRRIVLLEGPMLRLTSWWGGLSRRERILVGTLGAILFVLAIVFGVVKPLQAARAQALADIRTYETLNARIRAAGTLGPAGPPLRTGAASDLVTASATSVGLVPVLSVVPGGVRASVADGSYDAVLGWQADLARTSALGLTRVEIRKLALPGRVSAVVEYGE